MTKRARKNKSADYRTLRAKLLMRGVTLRGFALDNNYPIQTVRDAALGRRGGEVTLSIRKQLEEMANGTTK